jgi:hypothetical protein
MTTKSLPRWFWATFEQVDNPPPDIGDRDRFTEYLNPPKNDGTREGVTGRLRKVPPPLAGTVFQYYVLRGTQIEFVDAMGSPTLLGNTQLESGMQTTSSCMGCHGRATIGDRQDNIFLNGQRLYPAGTFFYPGGKIYPDEGKDPTRGGGNRLTVDVSETFWQQNPQKPNNSSAVALTASANGAPNPDWFIEAGTGRLRYTQLDFLWEFIFSKRESAENKCTPHF